MKIRSITCFLDPRHDPKGDLINRLGEFCSDAREQLASLPVEVETTRLSSPPFSQLFESKDPSVWVDFARQFQADAAESGFDYTSCGPALPDQPASMEAVSMLLREAKDSFFGTVIADDHFIYPRAIKSAARTIKAAAQFTPDGFANLRFAALANTSPYGPFFPGSYAVLNETPAFSLAVECADAILTAFQADVALSEMRARLLSELESFAVRTSSALEPLADAYHVIFKGFDFSPAPFPEPWCSLGGAVEQLGVSLGKNGAVAAAAVIADTLDQGNWKRAGYNGLMMPVLEDSLLAQRAGEGHLSIQDLLSYSAVCGTGLDTVPLPGDVSVEELESVLWDVAALSVRLGKPLTARLMPIPGKKAGDATEFDFGYFQNSRVMAVKGSRIKAPLASAEPIRITPRKPNYHHA